jgi:hypothetical protein
MLMRVTLLDFMHHQSVHTGFSLLTPNFKVTLIFLTKRGQGERLETLQIRSHSKVHKDLGFLHIMAT